MSKSTDDALRWWCEIVERHDGSTIAALLATRAAAARLELDRRAVLAAEAAARDAAARVEARTTNAIRGAAEIEAAWGHT